MKLTTKYLLALITTVLLLNLSVAASANKGDKGDKGDTGQRGPAGPAGATASCTPYHWGDTGPDGGKVFYVDGSGCHGLEAQPYDVGANSGNSYVGVAQTWSDAVSAAAAYNNNTRGVTGTPGLNCSTTAFPSLTALPATPNCWHLPSKTELQYLFEQKTVVGGFANSRYWSFTEDNSNDAWDQNFFSGYQSSASKTSALPVRAVRAF